MCGRYYLNYDNLMSEGYRTENSFDYETSFNITPQSRVPIVVDSNIKIATWGFFPDWLKKQKNSKPLFNTRWETIREKKTFQFAYKKSRCLVPISGWYEWKTENDDKNPYYFYTDEPVVYAAGLYWNRSNGDVEFSIITQEAYGDLANVHNRTPLLLNNQNKDHWLSDGDIDNLYFEITESKKTIVYFHRVSKAVNNPKNKNSSLINKYTEVPF